MRAWQLQEAKARFSEVVKEASLHGPQEITLRGEPAVVMISKAEYNKMLKPKPSFVDFIKASPLMDSGISLKRDSSVTRDADL
ncbi:MAG: type II toxin-antitoxin system Phd/YefM family antitoxin [Cellulomonas sp.]|nr:type II toxin-antitoxin system Phd/YefM family antitoxin [Rickettsiella sp.]